MDLLICLTKLIFRHALPRFIPEASDRFDQRIQRGLRFGSGFGHDDLGIVYSSQQRLTEVSKVTLP
jgi:hypothetical protein